MVNLCWRESAVKCVPEHEFEFEVVSASFQFSAQCGRDAASVHIRVHPAACALWVWIFLNFCPKLPFIKALRLRSIQVLAWFRLGFDKIERLHGSRQGLR